MLASQALANQTAIISYRAGERQRSVVRREMSNPTMYRHRQMSSNIGAGAVPMGARVRVRIRVRA